MKFANTMGKLRYNCAVENIAGLIKKLRIEKGITQEVFLFDTGINIYRIERGKTDMTCSTLIAVCVKLEISPNELFEMIEAKLQLENIPVDQTIEETIIKPKKHIIWQKLIELSTCSF